MKRKNKSPDRNRSSCCPA